MGVQRSSSGGHLHAGLRGRGSTSGYSRTWAGFTADFAVESGEGWETSFNVHTSATALSVWIEADLVNELGTPVAELDEFALLDPSGANVKIDPFSHSFRRSHLSLKVYGMAGGVYMLSIVGAGYAPIEVPVQISDIRHMSESEAASYQKIDIGTVILPK